MTASMFGGLMVTLAKDLVITAFGLDFVISAKAFASPLFVHPGSAGHKSIVHLRNYRPIHHVVLFTRLIIYRIFFGFAEVASWYSDVV